MKKYRTLFILTILAVIMICSAFAEDVFPVRVGDMQVDYKPVDGFRVSVFGTSIIKSSSIVVVSPSWVVEYYKSNNQPDYPDNVSIEDIENGKRIVFTHVSIKENTFEGKQIITLLEDNTFRNEFEFTYLSDDPGIMEWKIAAVNPLPIIGNTFTASDDETTTKGTIPMKAESGDVEESMAARRFKTLTIDSRIGPITIRTEPESGASFFDYRKNRWADANDPDRKSVV